MQFFTRMVLRILVLAAIAMWTLAMLWILQLWLLDLNIDLQLPAWLFGVGMLSMFIVSGFGICLGVYELIRNHRSAARLNRPPSTREPPY